MIEIAQLAQHAVTTLAPFLSTATATLLADKARDGAAGETGKMLLHWLMDSFKGKPAQATLDRVIAEPANAFRQSALRNEIEEAATHDPAFLAELTRLLAAAQPAGSFTVYGDQSATQTGDGSSLNQIQGNNNKVGR